MVSIVMEINVNMYIFWYQNIHIKKVLYFDSSNICLVIRLPSVYYATMQRTLL